MSVQTVTIPSRNVWLLVSVEFPSDALVGDFPFVAPAVLFYLGGGHMLESL